MLDRSSPPNPYLYVPSLPTFAIGSDDFHDGDPLPLSAGFGTDNRTPQLAWRAPAGTQSVLLSCFDVDAPVIGGFLHWAAVLPGAVDQLPGGAGVDGMPEGSISLLNDFGEYGWGGCAPPPGDVVHRYYFAVTALNSTDLGIDSATPFAKAQFLNLDKMVARAFIMGTYQL